MVDALRAAAAEILGDWRGFQPGDLQFWHRDDARLLLVALASVAVLLLMARLLMPRPSHRFTVAVPAVLRSIPVPRGGPGRSVHGARPA